jgi:hypothetical protein
MDNHWNERKERGAWVDHSTLRGVSSDSETRYTVALKGLVDGRWAEALRLTHASSHQYRAFRHDAGSATISFSCRTVDGAAQVFEALDLLEELVATVNEQAENWRADGIPAAFAAGPRGAA